MKRFLLVILLIPLLSGVDISNSVRHVRPLKGNFYSVADLTNYPPVLCKPTQYGERYAFGRGWLSGNVSHVGKINKSMSPFYINSCNYGPGPTQVTWAINGVITGANGDQYSYTGELIIEDANSSMTGTIHIKGGTGRFSEAVGEADLIGFINADHSADFTIDGWIMY
jgi:hypothetical protein